REEVAGQARQLAGRNGRCRRCCLCCRFRLRRVCGGRFRARLVVAGVAHAKKSCALPRAWTRLSTSLRVLYMAKEARQVAVTPKRASSGMTQWGPARTPPPERSEKVGTACRGAPLH